MFYFIILMTVLKYRFTQVYSIPNIFEQIALCYPLDLVDKKEDYLIQVLAPQHFSTKKQHIKILYFFYNQ